jgi:type II secretory pathway component PulC
MADWGWVVTTLLTARFFTLAPAVEIRPTKLPIDLVGVIVNSHSPEKSVCLLRRTAPDKAEETARPGDCIFQVANILAVESQKVVLKNLATGDLEQLSFWKTAPPEPMPRLQSVPSPVIAAVAPREIVMDIPKEIVEHFEANLNDVLNSAFAAPRTRVESGKSVIDGFEISRIKKGGIVSQLGILEGDVVVEANGVKLDSLDKVLTLYRQSQEAARVDLVVLRGGRRTTISFRQK